jgi:glycosyltransferase involved in cell wall biosynthesis
MTNQSQKTRAHVDPRVSVALCTYNGSSFLEGQLQTIASQTILPCELVICDDASTDSSISIIRAFAKQAPFPVRLFQNEAQLGPARNFEKAIRLCEAEIIFLCDQDDIWRPSKVARMVEAFDSYPQALYAFSDADMIDEHGDSLGQNLWGAVGLSKKLQEFIGLGQLEILLKHNIITGATMAFRASFRDIAMPIAPEWMHDYWIVLLASTVSFGVPVPECLVQYRRHASQVCGWRKMNFLQVCMESLKTRADDTIGKLEKFRRLLERLDSTPGYRKCPPERLRLLREKEDHLAKRSKMRASTGLSRIARVFAEASTGRYQRFSDSWLSIVRDL